jgi:1-acyl-sn-glycerol-3-phosphate acyltransferase
LNPKLFLDAFLSVFGWLAIASLTVAMTLLMVPIYLLRSAVDPQLRLTHAIAGMWGRALVQATPGIRIRMRGLENIPQDRPVIFMANHQSYVDVPVLYFLYREFKWVADRDLFWIPVFGWAMRMAGYIPINRKDPVQGRQALEKARAMLSHGISVFLFPEGTRSRTGLFGRFQPGGFRLAATLGVPIVPIVLVGTRQFLPRGSWIFRCGVKPQIHILPPIAPTSSDMKEIYRHSRQLRSQMMAVYRQHLKDFS